MGNHEQLYCPTLLYFLFFILSLYPKIRTNQIRYNHTFLNRFITYFAAKMNIIRYNRNFVVTVSVIFELSYNIISILKNVWMFIMTPSSNIINTGI